MTISSTIKMFEKPLGMRDSLPNIYEKTERVRSIGKEVLRNYGYQFVRTPTLEYYDTIGKASAIQNATLFKLVDKEGNTLVLRPDMTTPITRLVTSKLLMEKNPQRLAYFANVFRAQQQEGGRPSEFHQMGAELIGDTSPYSDAEIIQVCIDLLEKLQVDSFQITIGHAGVLNCILNDYTETEEQVTALHKLLVDRNFVGFEQAVRDFQLPSMKENALLSFITTAMTAMSLEQILPYVRNNEDVRYMEVLIEILKELQLVDKITIDFTLASPIRYYTGMLFEVYAAGSGFSIGGGGRYDGLLQYFGAKAGAIGFSLRIDRLLEVIADQQLEKGQTLILFDDASFTKASLIAKERRGQGELVTLQHHLSVENINAYKGSFQEVVEVLAGGLEDE